MTAVPGNTRTGAGTPEASADADELVMLGYVSGAQGVKGWIKVHSYTQPIEAILDYQPWLLGPDRAPVRIAAGQRHGKTVIAGMHGVDSREAALALVGQEIAVKRGQLPKPPRNSWYWTDLEGLEVVTTKGESLGRIVRMLETGANDVMVIEGERERLIPFVVGRFVQKVDLDAGLVQVDWDAEF